ncbi:amphi-Trp domain-containing protein [Thiomicrorhabdus sp. 6S3-12]|uniref:amphi-Trp domain-containing protein n=1 Tax=Thiomicrorhabdus sp. 6S3-12 TaxID=2819681 RepID=UPI001AADDEB2|nr:amphi-Trp domain-containing protein [Thiomicrorhabdus sp. 6S3-12]MBO1923093.1 amphi-Trp domain-containing protein [Thiomicrorhabdus sp. 6S3-12]
MAKKPQYFEHESLQDKESVVNYLKALSKGIEKGEILLSDDEDTQILNTSELTQMSIKASKTKKEQSLRIKLSWTNDTDDDDPDNAPLFIKAKKPKKKK